MEPALAFLRADIGPQIGAGHIFRALALGQTLARTGYRPVVFSREFQPELTQTFRALFDKKGIEFHSFQTEGEFLEELELRRPPLLFLDLRELGEYAELRAFLALRPKETKIISLDGFYPEDLFFDLTVLPYFQKDFRPAPTTLAGPEYFIFREELMAEAAAARAQPRFPVKNALITMGGADPRAVTSAIAAALCPAHHDIEFTAVVGPAFRDKAAFRAKAKAFANLTLVEAPEHLGRHLAAADVAVISGGLTKYEAALFGVPALVVAQSPQEEKMGLEFAALGTSLFLGSAEELTAGLLQDYFARLVKSSELLMALSKSGKNLVDTRGGERIIAYIKKNLS